MPAKWDDLSTTEQNAIERMYRGPYLMLTTAMADRLKELGLAEEKLGGTGLSKSGREMFQRRVGAARRRRLG